MSPLGQWHSDNDRDMTNHALALLPFLDDPVLGIGKATDCHKLIQVAAEEGAGKESALSARLG
jgi:hypothetical protein